MRSGLNQDFYKWVDDVRKAIRHETELEEKLHYYQARLTEYKAVTYDSIGSNSPRNNVEDNLLYVIGKIDATNKQIKEVKIKIKEYRMFKSALTGNADLLLQYLIEGNLTQYTILFKLKISKNRFYQLISELSRKRSAM